MEPIEELTALLTQIGLVAKRVEPELRIITCNQLTQNGHVAAITFELPTEHSLQWMRVWILNGTPITTRDSTMISEAIALIPGFCLQNSRPTIGTPVLRLSESRIDIAHQVPIHDGLPSLQILEEVIDGMLHTAAISAHLIDGTVNQPLTLFNRPKTQEQFEKDFIFERFFCHDQSDPENPTPPAPEQIKDWLADEALPKRARQIFETWLTERDAS